MRQRFGLVFFVCMVTVALAPAKAPPQDDARGLQGTWQVVELEANGAKKSAEEIQGWKVVFEGDELWLVKPDGTDPKLRFKRDSARHPGTIDLIVQEGKDKGKVAPGIYARDNGRLRLCVNIFGNLSYRPAEFKTKEGDGVAFATLERTPAR